MTYYLIPDDVVRAALDGFRVSGMRESVERDGVRVTLTFEWDDSGLRVAAEKAVREKRLAVMHTDDSGRLAT